MRRYKKKKNMWCLIFFCFFIGFLGDLFNSWVGFAICLVDVLSLWLFSGTCLIFSSDWFTKVRFIPLALPKYKPDGIIDYLF